MERAFRSAGNAPGPPEGRIPRPALPRQSASPVDLVRPAQPIIPFGIVSPVPLDPNHPDVARFLQLRDEYISFFSFYAVGALALPGRDHLAVRMPDVREKRIVGAWENVYNADLPVALMLPAGARDLPGQGGAQGRAALVGNLERQEAVQPFSAAGFNVRILRTLGYGGNGIAFLCEATGTVFTQNAGPPRKFVLKFDPGMVGMDDEKDLMMNLRRSKHLIRMLKVKDMWPEEALLPNFVDWADNVDSNPFLQMLEFMKHGDMNSMLNKVAHSDTAHMIREQGYFSKICWKIFICLIRACIDMQYPPRRKLDPETGFAQYLSEDGEDLNGGIPLEAPDGPLPPGYDLVHFDLDPQNILIGDFNADAHQGVPVFKVADFGLALRTNNLLFNFLPSAVTVRKRGKFFWYLPEQFHREWEFVDTIPSLQNPRPQVAGKYGPASNVYAIGNCVLELLTGYHHPFPPRARGPVNSPQGNDDFPADFVVHDVYGRPVPSFYTHGFPLRDVNTDQLLRDTVMRCVADKPADRPDLRELSDLADYIESQDNWDVRDDWMDFGLYFQHPPKPPVDVDQVPLGGWEEFFQDFPPSAPSGGNIGGGFGRPLNPNQAVDNVWFNGLPASLPSASQSPERTRSSLQAPGDAQNQSQGLGGLPETLSVGAVPSLSAPGTQPSVKSGSRSSQLGPRTPQRSAPSGDGTKVVQSFSPYLEALAALDIQPLLPPLDASVKSGNVRPRSSPRTPDHSARADASPSSPSPDLSDLRRRLRDLRADNTGPHPAASPFGDDRTTDAGTFGEPSPRRPSGLAGTTTLGDPMDVDTSSQGIGIVDTSGPSLISSAPSDSPAYSPRAQRRSPTVPRSPTPRRPLTQRPLRRVPRRQNLRVNLSSGSGFSWATGATRGSPPRQPTASPLQAPSSGVGSMVGRDVVVTEQVFSLYWPPGGRQQRGLLRRVVDRTRRFGRTILAAGGGGRRGRRDRQREALHRGVDRDVIAAGGNVNNASGAGGGGGGVVVGYAGLMYSPSRGREVFYVPPRGYFVSGFRRADWWYAVGEARYTYLYDPQSAAAQMILDAARQGVVPAQSEPVDVDAQRASR